MQNKAKGTRKRIQRTHNQLVCDFSIEEGPTRDFFPLTFFFPPIL
jgi:hypothetical protein